MISARSAGVIPGKTAKYRTPSSKVALRTRVQSVPHMSRLGPNTLII